MNQNLTQESYDYINSTLEKLRYEIMYIDHGETRIALMEHRDAMKRIVDGHPFKTMSPPLPPHKPQYRNQNGMTGFNPPPPLKSLYELPDPPAGLESCDAFCNEPVFPRWMYTLIGRLK
jgi:hypothetical protein